MSHNLTEKEALQIPVLVKDQTIREIAAHFGVHERAINRWIKVLRAKGIEVPTKIGRPPILR